MRPRLLDPGSDLDLDRPLPPLAEDLAADVHTETVVEAMAAGDRYLADVARHVLAHPVADPAIITYRQDVLRDCIARPETLRAVYDIAVEALADRRRDWAWGLGSGSRSPSLVLSAAVRLLDAGVTRLRELRALLDAEGDAFRSAGLTHLVAEARSELDDDYFATVAEHLRRLRFRHGLLMSAGLAWDNSGRDYVLRSDGGQHRGWRRRLHMTEPGVAGFSVDPRDEAGGQALSELTDRGINLVAEAVARAADHVSGYFTLLRAEIGFYLAAVNLFQQLDRSNRVVCYPLPGAPGSGDWSARGLCDAALALRSAGPVVGNDFVADRRPLVLVTGANSGGKSTFLRSVGLAQTMMQAGLFVTAEEYRAEVRQAVFTHFVREEDESMRSGRLDDELARVSRIADHLRPGCLVLFNESFSGTNEQEGSEIARQVVRAMVGSGVRVVFVTHQFDFADSCLRAYPDMLSLRAEPGTGGERDYRLRLAPPLPTSFGQDVYWRLGRWLGEEGPPAEAELDAGVSSAGGSSVGGSSVGGVSAGGEAR
jgi:hypothetical protein